MLQLFNKLCKGERETAVRLFNKGGNLTIADCTGINLLPVMGEIIALNDRKILRRNFDNNW